MDYAGPLASRRPGIGKTPLNQDIAYLNYSILASSFLGRFFFRTVSMNRRRTSEGAVPLPADRAGFPLYLYVLIPEPFLHSLA